MKQSKRALGVHCFYAEDGESIQELLKGCFRAFLYKEIQKSFDFLQKRSDMVSYM